MKRIKCFLIIEIGDLVAVPRPDGIVSYSHQYWDPEKDEVYFLKDAPVGAMWDATWYHGVDYLTGPDGHSYMVRTPGGDWCIDSKASNCTRKDDNVHKCWVRHGEAPNLTVDKNGNTCSAGAGSIQCGNYHGFLRNGYLEEC